MERMRLLTVVILLGLIGSLQGQNYFQGLNIDPTLISQTNLAITTLKNSLYLNFDCDPLQFSPFAPSTTSNSPFSLFEGYQTFQEFQGLAGFSGGFSGAPPQVNCQNSRQRGVVLFSLYQQVVTVTTLLQTIKSYLVEYNNIVIGDNNTVIGDNNFVIGSNDSLVGNNSWVFASDYQSMDPQNGVLVIELYLIELAKVPQLTYNPAQVIHCVNQEESNRQFNNFWKQAAGSHRFSF